jgi:riboflavin kinase / FMN adenylyltransferase
VLIGRPYAVSGRVRRGDALGRKLGFPTVNLVPARRLAPAYGVYAADVVVWPSGARHAGAAHWGPRGRLEVHLLDFDGDLYGKPVTVELRRYVREDRAFAGLDELRRWIAEDVERIRNE